MIKTKKTKCLIHREHTTYFWVEILKGEDKGIRVSIPKIDKSYSEELKEKISKLEEDVLIETEFKSDTKKDEPPDWKFMSLNIIRKM